MQTLVDLLEAGGYSKTFFLRWGSDPRPKPLYYRFIYHFRQKRCPFQVPLLTIMNKISWDSNAIFIIFCNFWVPRITVHSFRTFLTVPPPTIYKVKTRKKFWPTLFVGWGKGLGISGDWKTPHKCKSVPRLLSMIAVLLRTVSVIWVEQ